MQLPGGLGDGPVPPGPGRRHRAQRRQLRPAHAGDGELPSAGPWRASNLAWALGNAVVLLLAMRFSGLDSSTVPLATALLASGYLMVVNVLPVPGMSALAAPSCSSILSLTSDADQSAMAAALPLYRVVTWLLPMPVGA